MMENTCKNCSENLNGKYCYACGEKVVEKNDFSLKTLVNQMIDGVFNIDSKVYKTFANLLFKPGKLTTSYIEGIRKPFMKPIQVFLIANILFFLLLTQADILRIPAKYYFNSGKSLNIEEKLVHLKISETELFQKYDTVSANVSKSLVIIMVPLLALVLWILNYKSNFLYGMHLIFAMHYLSFFFLCCLLAVTVSVFGNKMVQLFILSFNLLYLYLSTKQVYKNTIIVSIFKSIVIVISFVFLTAGYRTVISYLSFKML
jgi:hypothetical protein